MKKKITISFLCTLLMVFGITIIANAGSYSGDGTYSGIYYEYYGSLTNASYSASLGYGNSSKQLKIGTTLSTYYNGTPNTYQTTYSTGYGSVGTGGSSPLGITQVKYGYFISGSQIATKTLTP